MSLQQIAIRLPAEIVQAADALVTARKALHARKKRWSESHRTNRTAILREALERGLAELAAEAKPKR